MIARGYHQVECGPVISRGPMMPTQAEAEKLFDGRWITQDKNIELKIYPTGKAEIIRYRPVYQFLSVNWNLQQNTTCPPGQSQVTFTKDNLFSFLCSGGLYTIFDEARVPTHLDFHKSE
jgi:hypothetical protein